MPSQHFLAEMLFPRIALALVYISTSVLRSVISVEYIIWREYDFYLNKA